MTVDALKEAIAGLPEGERHSLATWLNEMDYDHWDREIARDFGEGGRGQSMLAEVRREIAAGKTGPLRRKPGP